MAIVRAAAGEKSMPAQKWKEMEKGRDHGLVSPADWKRTIAVRSACPSASLTCLLPGQKQLIVLNFVSLTLTLFLVSLCLSVPLSLSVSLSLSLSLPLL